MEEFLFADQLRAFAKQVKEATTSFEAFTLPCDIREDESPMSDNKIKEFITRKQDPVLSAQIADGAIRLLLQKNVSHPDTFDPQVLSLDKHLYESMISSFRLPLCWSETQSCVGPFFWSRFKIIDGKDYMQIIYRKSDVKKKDVTKTRNWELVLSHERETNTTNGFFKGTERSDLVRCLQCLRSCGVQISHPLFLPILIFSYDIGANEEARNRETRERVRLLERKVTEASHAFNDADITKADRFDLTEINSELVDCHQKALWKRPEGYLRVLDNLENTLKDLRIRWPGERGNIDDMLETRLTLLRAKIEGIRTHRHITVSRLELIESGFRNLVSLKIYRLEKGIKIEKFKRQRTLHMEVAREQNKKSIERARKEMETTLETRKQTTMAILGIIFVPGAFVSSLFSTTFFDFHGNDQTGVVSSKFWIYWAVTLPATILLYLGWHASHRRTKMMLQKSEDEIRAQEEEDAKGMEKMMMAQLVFPNGTF